MKTPAIVLTVVAAVAVTGTVVFVAAADSAAPPAGEQTTVTGAADSVDTAGLATADSRFQQRLPIAPRIQWNANFGYCGEVSFISAGMYYGQYTSQWTARSLASPGVAQTEEESQLLLGENDVAAASRMKLSAAAFPTATQRSTPQYLAWVKQQTLAGRPTIIGVYENMRILELPGSGEEEYDHIVPVLGISSLQPLKGNADKYFGTDVLTFSDNGVYDDGGTYPRLFSYRFDQFQKTRAQANAPGGAVYSLRNQPPNYATAVLGVADTARVTVPVRLTSNTDNEGDQNQPVMSRPPAPKPITLTATVRVPDPTKAYNVYLYDNFAKVPVAGFNAARGKAVRSWRIPAGQRTPWTTTVSTLSNRTQVFRAVPTSAP
jgi:hypothetical protein